MENTPVFSRLVLRIALGAALAAAIPAGEAAASGRMAPLDPMGVGRVGFGTSMVCAPLHLAGSQARAAAPRAGTRGTLPGQGRGATQGRKAGAAAAALARKPEAPPAKAQPGKAQAVAKARGGPAAGTARRAMPPAPTEEPPAGVMSAVHTCPKDAGAPAKGEPSGPWVRRT